MPELEVGSPEWWVERLNRKLLTRHERIATYDDYYEGRHKLAFASTKFRQVFGALFSEYAENFAELVVDAVEERLTVQGFRFGEPDDTEADGDAWRIWQTNQLDAWSQTAHTAALVKEESYALVSPFETDWPAPDVPAITVEDPLEMIVESSASARRRRLAAFKRWVDDDGGLVATLYLPDGIYKWRSTTKPDVDGVMREAARWVRREVAGEEWPLPNRLAVVPVVPFVNKPRINGVGRSELRSVIPIQNAINKLVSDMLLAAEFSAFRQKYVTNLPLEVDPDTGKPKEPFTIAIDRLLVAEPNEAGEPEPRFGEFSETDLENYVKAIAQRVQHLASITRTPQHYLLQTGVLPSGETLKSTETGLVAKTRRKMTFFGESWEETLRLAFKALGDEARADAQAAETIWKDPESRTEGEHVDALVKLRALGIPDEFLWAEYGLSPQEIERIRAMRSAQALEVSAAFDPFRSLAPPPPTSGASATNGSGPPAPAVVGDAR